MAACFQNEAFIDAAWMTLKVAVVSSTFAAVLGTLAAMVLVRAGRFHGRMLFSGMVYAPLVMPGSDHRLVIVAVVCGDGAGSWLLDHHSGTHHFFHVLCGGGSVVAADFL
ncbi:MAG: hypothetical protein R3E89_12890 [Thiolinea sp.]